MKKYNFNNQEVTVYYAGNKFINYGHYKIKVEMELNRIYKMFSATTNNMRGLDAAKDLEGQEKYEALYELIDIDAEILEWVLEITE